MRTKYIKSKDETTAPRRFYVYLLFDFLGQPRYVGKGTGDRWLHHERHTDPINILKNSYVEQTTIVLGEVPKIKVQENLTEAEAFALEVALIKEIGRYPAGPLCNMTDGGDGIDREASSRGGKNANAARSPERRSEIARKVWETRRRVAANSVMTMPGTIETPKTSAEPSTMRPAANQHLVFLLPATISNFVA